MALSELHSMWRKGIRSSLLGAVFLGAVNTFGDFAWDRWIPGHRWYFGLAHGMLLMLALGFFLGHLGGSPSSRVRAAITTPLLGLVAAASFYMLAPLFGMFAMFLSWVLLWILVGASLPSLLKDGENLLRSVLRGLTSALLSGWVFFAVSDIWLRRDPGGPNLAYHFLCWSAVFLAAIVPLLLNRPVWQAGRAGETDRP